MCGPQCLGRVLFCSNDYPCNCHNALCWLPTVLTCCCCKEAFLESYDQVNRKDIKKMRKEQKEAHMQAMAAPTPAVMPTSPQTVAPTTP